MNIVHHHYRGCALPNVWLRNGFATQQTTYGKAVAIHDLEGLHRTIGLCLVNGKPLLTGAEVRFLRKELDMSQAHLGRVLGSSESSVRAWENHRGRISRSAERMLRVLYREHVDGDGTVRDLVERLAELNRETHKSRIELEDTEHGWRSMAV